MASFCCVVGTVDCSLSRTEARSGSVVNGRVDPNRQPLTNWTQPTEDNQLLVNSAVTCIQLQAPEKQSPAETSRRDSSQQIQNVGRCAYAGEILSEKVDRKRMNNSLQPNKAVHEHSAPYSTGHVVFLSVFSNHKVSIIVPGLQRLDAFQPRAFSLENLVLGYE